MSTSAPPPSPGDATGTSPRDTIRRAARERRAALSDADRRSAALGFARLLRELEIFDGAGTVATFLPTDGELDPNLALPALRDRGWQVTLPVVGADRSMHFVQWEEGDTMVRNRFGIAEPGEPHQPVDVADLDVVLVPCVALDQRGNRLGFGAGFYDRAFAPVAATTDPRALVLDAIDPDATTPPRKAVLVGVVHDVQLVERIEPDPWDVPMDLIVTGTRVVVPSR